MSVASVLWSSCVVLWWVTEKPEPLFEHLFFVGVVVSSKNFELLFVVHFSCSSKEGTVESSIGENDGSYGHLSSCFSCSVRTYAGTK